MFLRVVYLCLRRQLILSVAVLSGLMAGGCSFIGAELNNRGGYLDAKGDEIWFIADTKPMRVLRAYVLLGSITRMAQTNYKSERELIVKHVNTSVQVAAEAFYCAYSQPGTCVYFDERMVELEISVLRLLVSVLSKKEEEELFQAVSKNLSNTFPLLKSFDTMTSLIDGLTSTGELAVNASKAIASLLKVGQIFYIQGRRIGALYRDAIELQMVTTISSMDTICAIKRGQYRAKGAPYFESVKFETRLPDKDVEWAVQNFYGAPEELPDTCESYRRGVKLWQRGAGDLKEWVNFLYADAAKYRGVLIPRTYRSGAYAERFRRRISCGAHASI
jgi:hypothetical protein